MNLPDLLVWPGQAEFLAANTRFVGLFTGAGYGKSDILIRRAVQDCIKNNFWWKNELDFKRNHLKFIFGAPHDRYLTIRLCPAFRGYLDNLEMRTGSRIRKRTGRNRDGWFGSKAERMQEMVNGCTFYFYPLHGPDAAVATDAACLYIDEVTMLDHPEIWDRSIQRIRDPRALHHHIAFVGTPERDHFIYEKVIDPSTHLPRKDHTIITDSSIKNPMLGIPFFEQIGRQASDAFIDMQVMGKWVRGAGGQRFGHLFDEAVHLAPMNIGPHIKGIEFDIGWDPGYRTGSCIIAYAHPSNIWCVVDEIIIKDMTTERVCEVLLEKGYNYNNIRFMGMDPRDANKRKSNSRVTDAEIVRKLMQIKPTFTSVEGFNSVLRTRLDVLDSLLVKQRIKINEELKPRSSHELGIVNSIKQFATEKMKEDQDNFIDRPTRDTIQRWKHSIDALHYILMKYEHGEYRRAKPKVAKRLNM